jgi:hypothetical protein
MDEDLGVRIWDYKCVVISTLAAHSGRPVAEGVYADSAEDEYQRSG